MDELTDTVEMGDGPSTPTSHSGTESAVAISPDVEVPDEIESPVGVSASESQGSHEQINLTGVILSPGGRYSTKRKLNVKSIETKYEAILAVERGEKRKSEIAKEFGIPSNTLSSWLKCADKIKNAYLSSSYGPERKKMRTGNYEDVEQAVFKWYVSARKQNMPVTGTILKNKAGEIAASMGETNFKCSAGWLDRFKGRYAISFKNYKDFQDSRCQDSVHWSNYFATLLTQFHPSDIYDATETALLYQILPNKVEDFKNVDLSTNGGSSEERLTALVCSNMTGTDKLPLVVIGKEENPFALRNVKTYPASWKYVCNEKVFMTAEIFTNWVMKMDATFHKEHRNVVLVINISSVHPKIDGLKAILLIHVPASVAPSVQPMNQGILHHLKVQYRRNLILSQERLSNPDLNILDAIVLLVEAWYSIRPEKILRCFKQCGFRSVVETKTFTSDDEDKDPNSHLFDYVPMLDEYARLDDTIATCELVQLVDDVIDTGSDSTDRYYTDTLLAPGIDGLFLSRSATCIRDTDFSDLPPNANIISHLTLPVTDVSDDNVMTMRNVSHAEIDKSSDAEHPHGSVSQTVESETARPTTMDAMQACVTLRAYLGRQDNTSELLQTLAKISDRVMKEALLDHQSLLNVNSLRGATPGTGRIMQASGSGCDATRVYVKHERVEL